MQTKPWDPVGHSVSSDQFIEEYNALNARVDELKRSSWRIPVYAGLLALIPVSLLIIFIWSNVLGEKISLYILVFSVFPLVGYISYIKGVQQDILFYLLCLKNGWVYKPTADEKKIKGLIKEFPEVFSPGHDQVIEDQIWGEINTPPKSFWAANFTFTIGEGKGSRTFTHPVFLLKLEKRSSIDFYIENAAYQEKSEIKTESNEFNKRYKIVSDYTDQQAKNEILQILSPSVIVRLISLSNTYSIFRIYIHDTLLILEFEKSIWQRSYTNFFKKVAIDKRDEKRYYNILNKMIDLMSEVIQYI